MATEVIIVASALICAAGNENESWQTLKEGKTALSPFALPGLNCHVGRIRGLHDEIGSRPRLMALIRSGLDQLQPTTGLARTHLLVATTKGAADETLQGYDKPGQGFAWQVAETIAGEIKQTAACSTVSAACASGTVALIQASQLIERGEADQVLVVGIDILSRFVLAGFAQLQALAAGPCMPFAKDRDGLCLGEGIGLMLLSSREMAHQHGWTTKATIRGWGVGCDASHITAPCRQASGLASALVQATAGGTRKVGAINAHGTGTIYNDAMEITAFKNFWGENPPPFHSVKGTIGHCLGAAGVIEACLAVRSLKEKMIPGTVGLTDPDYFAHRVASTAQSYTIPTILSCNSGFGGINAAILLASS